MAGFKGIGRVLSAEDYNRSRLLLNLIGKQWMGKADFAPGLKVWTRKRAFLFPELAEEQYILGTGGDHATASYNSSTLSADEAAAQTVLSIIATTGMVNGDNIGIRLNDGTIHWTTIVSFVANTSVTITTQLPSAAASGSTVYWYTNKIMLPLSMISVRWKDTSGNETVVDPMSLGNYEEGLLKKNNSGTPTRYLYERGVTTGTLTFDYNINDTTQVYLLTFLRPAEDFDASADTPDYPQEWFKPLVGQLAIDVATANGRPVTQEMKDYRNEALSIAGNLDPDNAEPVFFECER